jgi:hypothetical protein
VFKAEDMEGTKSILHNYLHEFALQNAHILQTGNWMFVQEKITRNFLSTFPYASSVSQDCCYMNTMNKASVALNFCGTQLLIPRQSYFFFHNTLGIMAPSVDNKSKLKTSRSLYKSEQHLVSLASGCAKTQTKNYIWHHEL